MRQRSPVIGLRFSFDLCSMSCNNDLVTLVETIYRSKALRRKGGIAVPGTPARELGKRCLAVSRAPLPSPLQEGLAPEQQQSGLADLLLVASEAAAWCPSLASSAPPRFAVLPQSSSQRSSCLSAGQRHRFPGHRP